MLLAVSCGNGKKENEGNLNDLKAKLEKERKTKASTEATIKSWRKNCCIRSQCSD
jgi:hypothetical protein